MKLELIGYPIIKNKVSLMLPTRSLGVVGACENVVGIKQRGKEN
jgi:hypothetical protein